MPSFGTAGFNWSDEKIAAVLSYVRQEWGNKAPAVDAARVAQVRQQVGDRKAWTQDELLQVK
jgi:mono/diheme cytochrome c family protein